MLNSKWVAAAALTACLSAGSAQAASYTFDFTASTQGWFESISFASAEDPGVTVTASAGTYDDNGTIRTGDSRIATFRNAGIGICGALSSRRTSCADTDHRVDGSGTNDLAIFAFEKPMSVTSISFSYFDSVFVPAKYEYQKTTCKVMSRGQCRSWNYRYVLVTPSEKIADMFDLFLDNTYELTDAVGKAVSFADLPSVLSFGIGASGRHDAFKITGLTAEHIEAPAPVPLPAGGLLLLTAMGGFAALKRRRKAA